MKLRQITFKLVSLVMVFAIIFSISATTISAINLDDEKEKINEVIENGYEVDETTKEEVENAIEEAQMLATFIIEYYDLIYFMAHLELVENGTIDAINDAIDEATDAIADARAELSGYAVEEIYEETKELLVQELMLTEATLFEIKTLVNYDFIDEETLESLEALVLIAGDHAENIGDLALEVGVNFIDPVINEAVEIAGEYAVELANAAYAYILENAPVAYEQLVDALTDLVATESHEAAQFVYAWLINNPEKVIEFFDVYGEDIVDFIADNGEYIAAVIGFVGATYGEDILFLVLENADVILPAVVDWFEIHGDLVWDLLVVYFNAIVEYYDLGLDLGFDVVDGIHGLIDALYTKLGELLDMIKDGVYDYVESLGIVEEITALLAKLNAIVLEGLEDLELAIQNGVRELGEYVFELIMNFIDDAIRGEFTPTEDTYYVAVNGGEALYADLLAEAFSKNLDSDITLDKTTWGAIDYDMLAKADLVTIGYDENEITAFAIAQLLGYVNDYVDGDVRDSANLYVNAVFGALEDYYAELKAAAAVNHIKLPDFDFESVEGDLLGQLNGLVDMLIGDEELSAELEEIAGAELAAVLDMAGTLLAGQDAEELDWTKFIPESELHYVDELRAELRAELLAQGAPESFTVEVPVLDYLLANYEALGLGEIAEYVDFEGLAGELTEVATYSITIPVVDALVFAIESYVYSNVEFNYNYGKLIVDLYKLNPDATVILLGHYNAFDYELSFGGETLDVSKAYSYVAALTSVQPFAYALLSEKVAYVDISDAETYYESYVNAGVDNNVINFVLAYLADSTVTDVTVAGHTYIYEQILNYLTIGCEHVYDNACDNICNKCGQVRPVADHEYNKGVCIHCGHRDPEYKPAHHEHVYDDCYDTDCNVCGEVREAIGHVYDNCEDTDCYRCGHIREAISHVYDNCLDTDCNHCGLVRPATTHVYNNACDADCNRCGETREAADHVYSGCTDANCNVCGLERKASAHTVDNCADNICNVCGQNVAVNGHKFGDWTVTVEPTRKAEGQKTHTCANCGLVESKVIKALEGIGGGAIAGITVGSVAVAGAAGFGIYWFLLQKKTFAELLAALGVKGAEATAAAGAEAAATEAATEATAEATAEAAAEAASETVSE